MTDSGLQRRILIADDHPMVRDWLSQLINREPDLVVCGEASNAAETLHALETLQPAMAVVDLSMEGCHGISLIKEISTRHPHLPILVVSMHDESLYAERILHAGARGYISKREGGTRIKQAIRRVLAGEIAVSEKVDAKILRDVVAGKSATTRSPLDQLSDRELEVFQLLGHGAGPTAIATELHVSVRTVEGYAERIREKLRLGSARELRQYAIEFHSQLSP